MEVKELQKQTLSLVERVGEPVVNDDSSLERANQRLSEVKKLMNAIDSTFDPIIDKMNKAHKEAIKQKKQHKEPLLKVEMKLKRPIGIYLMKLEEERKAREREIEEQKRQLEEERQKKLEEAKKAQEEGDNGKAQEIVDHQKAAEEITNLETPKEKKVDGLQRRIQWKWNVKDRARIPREFLIPNAGKITAEVQRSKGLTNIPGIRVFSDVVIVKRRCRPCEKEDE